MRPEGNENAEARDADAPQGAWDDAAAELFSEGHWEELEELLDAAPADDGLRWLYAARMELERQAPQAAGEALERARTLLGADDPGVLQTEGLLLVVGWRLEEARAVLERLRRLDPEEELASHRLDLALLLDLAGDHDAADALLREGHRRAPDAYPTPIRLTPDAFQVVVDAAAADLPPEFRAFLEDTAVVIDPMPTAELLDAPGSGLPPDVFGLFLGRAAGEEVLSGEMPPTIFLFQRNLEREAGSREALEREVWITLYHELGHALGFDEEGVDAMGLG
jgi:predicted Zn-dependent protease with MMP-like domain